MVTRMEEKISVMNINKEFSFVIVKSQSNFWAMAKMQPDPRPGPK